MKFFFKDFKNKKYQKIQKIKSMTWCEGTQQEFYFLKNAFGRSLFDRVVLFD